MSWRSMIDALLKAAATPAPAPTPAPEKKPRATIAFVVLDEGSNPIPDAFATFADGVSKQANDDGYIAVEREVGIYNVTFTADDFKTRTKQFELTENRQFTVKLTSTKPAPVPVPAPAPVPPPIVVQPAPEPPKQPVTDEEFHAAWLAILRKHGNPRTVNLQTLNDTKADVEAMGCEWQHDSAGTLRPRLFLPSGTADPYGRAYDMGLYGEGWQWIKRY